MPQKKGQNKHFERKNCERLGGNVKKNWIEDVLVDLSKSALNEGRLKLYSALSEFTKIASTEQIARFDAPCRNSENKNRLMETAEILDFCEYRYRKQIDLK